MKIYEHLKEKGADKTSFIQSILSKDFKGRGALFPFKHECNVFKLSPVKVILYEDNLARGGQNLELLQPRTTVHEKRKQLSSSFDRT